MTTKVLLVEDEPAYARFLREVLLEADADAYAISSATTVEEASLQLGAASFDIILLDLGLPDADGIEALTQVSALAPATPIVVLSALNDLDVALESMRVGAQEYLVKGQSEHVLLPRAIRYAVERKRLHDSAEAARLDAERANAVKDEFIAMLGHELRNPLAPIVTGLALLQRNADAAGARELGIVQRQVQHVVRLVDDLLDVARIARGKMDLDRAHVDIADIVAASIETARPLLEERRHQLHVEVPRGVLFVFADHARLSQVVANLLTNAAKYTDRGGCVSVTAQADGEMVELVVKDNGMGMTPELLGRVFNLFEQGARTSERAAGGLGLGLAIVRNIMTMHQGTVSAMSQGPGAGSVLTLRLPRTAGPPNSAPVPRMTPLPLSASPRRILVVDDNVDGAELLEAALSGMGHTVRIAHDGPTALALLDDFEPEVALLDIGLPEMDGYELARRMRGQLGARAPRLIAVTGYGQASDVARARAAGFDRHLVKPVDLATLQSLFDKDPVAGT